MQKHDFYLIHFLLLETGILHYYSLRSEPIFSLKRIIGEGSFRESRTRR